MDICVAKGKIIGCFVSGLPRSFVCPDGTPNWGNHMSVLVTRTLRGISMCAYRRIHCRRCRNSLLTHILRLSHKSAC